MQFSVIGQWLIDGKSPHSGQPVIETCRIVKPGQGAWYYFDGRIRSIYTPSHLISYQVGKTYAIQPGRGQKAVGRTPPIESIRRQDVRDMTQEDAIARGFCSVVDYWLAWIPMHDRGLGLYFNPQITDYRFWNTAMRSWDICSFEQIPSVLAERPTERYDAWVIRFAADPAPPAGEGSE